MARGNSSSINCSGKLTMTSQDSVVEGSLTIRAGEVEISAQRYVTKTAYAVPQNLEITSAGNVKITCDTRCISTGTLTINSDADVEITSNAASSDNSSLSSDTKITARGTVTLQGANDNDKPLGNLTFTQADGADYVYFTSADPDTEAIDASVTPLPASVDSQYLRIEKKVVSNLTVINGIATVNGQTATEAYNGQKVTVTATAPTSDLVKFDHWELEKAPAGFTLDADKLQQSSFDFIMPAGDVSLTAVYSYAVQVTHGTATVSGKTVDYAVAGDAVTVAAEDRGDDYQFDHWALGEGSAEISLPAGAQDSFTFTMPAKPVELIAVYKAAVKVTNGTADPVYALEGETVTVTATTREAPFSFSHWTLDESTDEDFALSEEQLHSEEISFAMPAGAVKLTAHYSFPAGVLSGTVSVTDGTASSGENEGDFIWAEVGSQVDISAALDPDLHPGTSFDYWEVVTPETLELDDPTNASTFFTMPSAHVELIAHWKSDAALPDPDPMDPDFGNDDGAAVGVAVAGAAVLGGAAIAGGYEVATRVILKNLLPAGASIPTNRAALALLIWTTKGKPEPAAQPAFADVSDAETVKAAQWCVEQGYLTAANGNFQPNGWVSKANVIQTWNKAFPKQG